ncbi:MAG: hypothetical protein KKH79_04185 [Candidatus Thermoplasmatota archaeon]|nr:hypothetical protein [Candidatus Thermoplasmatota archaeon]
MMNTLKAYDRKVRTPFGLLGTNENALTFSLGYLYSVCPEFLRKTLHRLDIKNVHFTRFGDIEISLQKNTVKDKRGITDLEIRLPGKFHIIIEGKIGLDIPSLEQCEKYLPELEEPIKRLAILQNAEHSNWIAKYKRENHAFKGKLKGLYWAELVEDAISLLRSYPESSSEGYWLRNFIKFAKEEYYMGSYTHEVWIVPTNKNEWWPGGLSFHEIHTKRGKIYFWSHGKFANRKPLYIASRCGGFDSVQKVLRIEHDVTPISIIPELKKVRGGDKWQNLPSTIWYLSEPIPLGRKIRTGPGLFNVHVTCDFDLLLTCDTVVEIRDKMKERREGMSE